MNPTNICFSSFRCNGLEVGVSSETSCVNLFIFSVWLTTNLSPSSRFYLRRSLSSLSGKRRCGWPPSALQALLNQITTNYALGPRGAHADVNTTHTPDADGKPTGANTWPRGPPEYKHVWSCTCKCVTFSRVHKTLHWFSEVGCLAVSGAIKPRVTSYLADVTSRQTPQPMAAKAHTRSRLSRLKATRNSSWVHAEGDETVMKQKIHPKNGFLWLCLAAEK